MKSRFLFVILIASASALSRGRSLAGTDLCVTGDRVNIRARSSAEGERVCTVSKGDLLKAVDGMDSDSEWVKILPPAKADLWVYSDLVKDGVVSVSRLRVRSGPGIAYPIVGSVSQGVKLTVRGRNGDWYKVKPPEGAHVWISRKYVEHAKQPAVRPADAEGDVVKKPVQPQKPVGVRKPPMPVRGNPPGDDGLPVRPSDPKERPDTDLPLDVDLSSVGVVPLALEGKPLDQSEKQGVKVTAAGELRKAGYVFRRPSPYRIVKEDIRGRCVTSFYVLGKEESMKPLLGKTLRISGREYWIQGVRYPLIDPSKIEQESN